MSPSEIVHAQFDAYNARNVDALCSYYAEDCVFTDLAGAATLVGREAFRAVFTQLFAERPQNRSWSAQRMSVGNVVVDHEITLREPGAAQIHSIAIYTVRDGKIVRLAMGQPDVAASAAPASFFAAAQRL